MNKVKSTKFSAEGLARLRRWALEHKPWTKSTGPRTAAGKAISAENGRKSRKGELSVLERRAAVADIEAMVTAMRHLRRNGLSDVAPYV